MLDAKVLSFNPASSSMSKGETFYDTIKTFESFGVDGIVIRSSQTKYYDELKKIKCAIINAGDGTGDHPSQNLLDLLTIYDEFGHFEGIKVLMVGDIIHSRVAHGNAKIMKRLGMECMIAGPKEFLDDTAKIVDFDEGIKEADVVMMLRIQRERNAHLESLTDSEYLNRYGLTKERVSKMKNNAIIMHPAPFNRGVELEDSVVECDIRSGKLAKCKAILVGHFSDMTGQKHFGITDPYDIVAQYVRPLGIPVVFGLPTGHEDPNVALYMGREVTVTVGETGAVIEF